MIKAAIVAVLLSVLIATGASAADMPLKAPPPPAAAWSWTGFYVGANVGYGWAKADSATTGVSPCPACPPLPGVATFSTSASNHADGVIGGGQIGYNWQVTNYLVGLEADIQGSDQKRSKTVGGAYSLPLFFFGGAVIQDPTVATDTTQLDWFGTVRGRLGYVADRWLLYATGGLAYGEVNVNSAIAAPATIAVAFPNAPFTVGGSATRVGWVVGVGVENALSDRWSWKLEYLYMDLGHMSATGGIPPQGCIGNALACNGTTAGMAQFTTSAFTDNIVRVGVNYRWR